MDLTFDIRDGRKANLQTIPDPTWVEIENAIRRLDAAAHTEVALNAVGQLTIGGGSGQYFVSIFTDDERSLVLVDASKSEDESIHLVSGGQEVSLPKRKVVAIDAALSAARSFFDSGRPDQALTWIEE